MNTSTKKLTMTMAIITNVNEILENTGNDSDFSEDFLKNNAKISESIIPSLFVF